MAADDSSGGKWVVEAESGEAPAPIVLLLENSLPTAPFNLQAALNLLAGCVAAVAFLLLARAILRCFRRVRIAAHWPVSFSIDDDGVSLLERGAVSSSAPVSAPRSAEATWADLAPHWSLEGKVAMVTGGSKGLGRAIVEELLKQGCEVITCARDLEPLRELMAREPRCVGVQADVATAGGRNVLRAVLAKRYANNLDLLVNNVGSNIRKPSVEYSEAEFEALQQTNLGSAFHLTRSVFDALRSRKGCVVNVSSVSGSTVDSTGAPYHMTKAALEHLTRYLAVEWGPHGVRVNAVAPWFIHTPLTAPLLADGKFHDAVRRATPMRRVGEPHEVACAVAFLAMPAAGYISGQVLAIDGAMMQAGFTASAQP